jgi:hypothetical protein
MTLEEIENETPNGLHDAELRSIRIDYSSRTALLGVNLHVGLPSDASDSAREAYRAAEIVISGLVFVAIDPPASDRLSQVEGGLWIDAGPGTRETLNPDALKALPADAFVHWIYVREWNSFIHIVARSASLNWLG